MIKLAAQTIELLLEGFRTGLELVMLYSLAVASVLSLELQLRSL